MSRRNRPIALPAPYLRRLWLDDTRISERDSYPFCLPIFAKGFDLSFDSAITIIVGENGTGKSTILEGIAALAGFDDAGGARDIGHSTTRALSRGQEAFSQRGFVPVGCRR